MPLIKTTLYRLYNTNLEGRQEEGKAGVAFVSSGPGERRSGCHVHSCRLRNRFREPVQRIRCGVLDGIGSRRTSQVCRRACSAFKTDVNSRAGPLSYLALSGGGADGAYGAGVLNGWTAAGTRPRFSVVSGVSTGALIAPFAFLGPAYDATLRDVYTSGIAESLLDRPASSMLCSDRACLEIGSCANSSRAMSDRTCSQQSPPNTPRAEAFSS